MPGTRERLRLAIRGAVQGVGFRPFVYRLARGMDLRGWVRNAPSGVVIEAEGGHDALHQFLLALTREPPPRAIIQSLEPTWLDPAGHGAFSILDSDDDGAPTALVLPDIALCHDCRAEVFDPANRRYRYPFTTCTNCGPRYSVIERLPYDRPNTSMRAFTMCATCTAEYHHPENRRFHAQPNACPICGPQVALWDRRGATQARADAAVRGAVAGLRAGRIVAVKGLGGFHLLVDAGQARAVARLRARKHRDAKPFAVMVPSLESAARHGVVDAVEARLLTSPESPIVLLRRRADAPADIVGDVAPGMPTLGVMLPYTPLHALLLADFGAPVVATSGNLSDEPICIDEHEALERLADVADDWLVHDRPIVRHVDDSIARVMLGREAILRRARGYAPLPVPLGADAPPLVAVGGQLKNTVAITAGANAFLSQHIGDLEAAATTHAFTRTLASLESLFGVRPAFIAADLHPDYWSTRFAERSGLPVVTVQHHHAHVRACMADNGLEGPVLGVAWDGTGFGSDGTIWGGEFLRVDDDGFSRFGCLRPFRLPGGDRAVRDPRRTALGILSELDVPTAILDGGPLASFPPSERALLRQALNRRLNAPITTSAGRVFDAAAAIMGLCGETTFEGEAAMKLEFAVDPAVADAYPIAIEDDAERFAPADPWLRPSVVVDWGPLMLALVEDVQRHVPLGTMAARFHNALVEAIAAVAQASGDSRVVLSGGCFQNAYLTERAVRRLRASGLRAYWHQRVPPNDGGVALGQIAAVLAARRQGLRHAWPLGGPAPVTSPLEPRPYEVAEPRHPVGSTKECV